MAIEGPEQLTTGGIGAFKAFLVNAADLSRRDITREAQWTSSNSTVLSIFGGSALGLAPGHTTVEARFEGLRGTRVVSINPIDHRPPARLVIESLSVTVHPLGNGYFGYLVRFRLRETGGESSAIIGDVVVHGPNGSDATGPGCWRDPVIVPAGKTLDLFDTDAGLNWLLYCAPGSSGLSRTPTLRVVVNFTNESGLPGQIEAVVTGTP